MIAVLCGGVGAARMLDALRLVIPAKELVAIVNTGDDLELHGLSISPDLDTITYTLAGAVNPASGWGLAGETFAALSAFERYGMPTWFGLGDQDLATHIFRSARLAAGATLSEVTDEVRRAWGVEVRILPMSNDPVRTRLRLASDEEIDFQEYFVKLHHDVAVGAVRFLGANSASAAPGVLDALSAADIVVIAPSNPIVSIGPILAIPEIAHVIRSRRDSVVAVSPIIGGKALKGPADRLMVELGADASALGVVRLLEPFIGAIVIDDVDVELRGEIESLGIRVAVCNTIMRDPTSSAKLAEVVVSTGAGE